MNLCDNAFCFHDTKKCGYVRVVRGIMSKPYLL